MRWIVLAAVIALAALSVLAAKVLFSDGPYALLSIMTRQGYWHYDKARAFAHIIAQTPPVLAMKLGERNVIPLIYLYSAGLVVPPMLLWVASLAMHFRSALFWVLVLGFSVTHLTAGFCSLGEYNMAYAFAALCFALMLKPSMGVPSAVALVASAVGLTRCYEATVFIGPCLAAVAVIRMRRRWPSAALPERLALLGAVLMFAVGAAIAARSIVSPRDAGNLSNALATSWILESRHLVYVMLMITLAVAAPALPRALKVVALVAGAVASVAYATQTSFWNPAIMSYASRTVSGVLLCVVFSIGVLGCRSGADGPRSSSRWLAALSAMLFVALSVPAFVQTFKYGVWLKRYESIAVAQSDWVPIDRTDAMDEGGYCAGFAWAWTNPSQSMVLRADNSGGLLNASTHTGWQPFDPRQAASNPLAAFRREGELFGFGVQDP